MIVKTPCPVVDDVKAQGKRRGGHQSLLRDALGTSPHLGERGSKGVKREQPGVQRGRGRIQGSRVEHLLCRNSSTSASDVEICMCALVFHMACKSGNVADTGEGPRYP